MAHAVCNSKFTMAGLLADGAGARVWYSRSGFTFPVATPAPFCRDKRLRRLSFLGDFQMLPRERQTFKGGLDLSTTYTARTSGAPLRLPVQYSAVRDRDLVVKI